MSSMINGLHEAEDDNMSIEEKLRASERERKRLEGVLADVEQKLDIVVQSVSEIIYTLDSNGLITFINDGVRHFGFDSSELIGINIFEIIHPKDRDRAVYRVNERRTGERSTRSYELRFITKDQQDAGENAGDNSYDAAPRLTINAEGRYSIGDGDSSQFVGTVGVARPQMNAIETAQTNEKDTFIAVCASCRNIRNGHGDWERFEAYFSHRCGFRFTHTICPSCSKKLYSDIGLNPKP